MVFLCGFADAVALPRAYYGPGTGLIVFSYLECSGMESSLFECDHYGTGNHYCRHNEDAGVICQGNMVQSIFSVFSMVQNKTLFSADHVTAKP